VTACRICNAEIEAFMSFGNQPVANGFLMPEQFADEYFFEMKPAYCPDCHMFQITEQPAPEQMFHEDYAFFSGTSRYMATHFQNFAESLLDGHLSDRTNPFVVELGSNDGITLRHFAARNVRHAGIEPSLNVANVAREAGVNTISEFFNAELAESIRAASGPADVIIAANVMCHIPDLHSVAKGVCTLLRPDGLLIFEDPYLGDVLAKTSYDQIYDEHVFVFSAHSVRSAFKAHGLELVDVEPQITHGGSMRYTLAQAGSRPISERVDALIAAEKIQGLDTMAAYQQFRHNCEDSRSELISLLDRLADEGKRVIGYGATSKSTTVMNYCGITSRHLEFISDTTPTKHNKFSPGAHIPIKPHDVFVQSYPDYALLFAWNHKAEIMENEGTYRDAGGRWIVYVPKVEIF